MSDFKSSIKVKICGVTHPEDAAYAARHGADYIGLILAEGSPRRVSIQLAREITQAAREYGAISVGVFSLQAPELTLSMCREAGIDIIQTHVTATLYTTFKSLQVQSFFPVVRVRSSGEKEPHIPFSSTDIVVYDHQQGETGSSFNWDCFQPPVHHPWILAGGLKPENVTKAVSLFRPFCVDVASGVEYPHVFRKDPERVKEFIDKVKF